MRVRNEFTRDYTKVHNDFLRDGTLSIAARGLLITMLHLPDDWGFSVKGLMKMLESDGERKISRALKELEDHRYLVRERICDKNGKVVDWEYIVCDQVLSDDTLSRSFRLKKKPADVETEENADPHHFSSLLQSADMVNADMNNPDMEKPDMSTVCKYQDRKQTNTKKETTKKQRTCAATISQSKQQKGGKTAGSVTDNNSDNDMIEEYNTYRAIILDNISYDALVTDYNSGRKIPGSAAQLDEFVTVMLDCVCSTAETIRVGGSAVPKEVVKSVMLKLDSSHILYVLDCINSNKTEIKNIKSYIITSLYNAPGTITSYYNSKASYDMYGNNGN